MIPGIESSAGALGAERLRLDIIAGNLANAQNTNDASGGVYRRKMVVFESQLNNALGATGASAGSSVAARVVDDPTPLPKVYLPGHPKADAKGMVEMPNVDPLNEMVDMMTASRSYQANLQVIQTGRTMFEQSLKIAE
ncbi:MAG: flagellar basal body rod protein FlgC [Verrucomicrobiota bacterium]